jgi:hypothetical protein
MTGMCDVPIKLINKMRGRRGRDRMVVGITRTTYAISAYRH